MPILFQKHSRTLDSRRLALPVVLAVWLLSTALLLAVAPARAQDVPRNRDVPLRFLPDLPVGNYGIAQEGVGLFPDLTAGNITVPVPATCADGSVPGIALATLTWVHRNSNVVNLDDEVRFGPAAGPLVTITADRQYGPWDIVRTQRLIFTTYHSDVTALVQPGVNTYRIEDFTAEVQFGAGLQIVYECPELPLGTLQRAEGNDFYYVQAEPRPQMGPNSEVVCTTFEASASERIAQVGLQPRFRQQAAALHRDLVRDRQRRPPAHQHRGCDRPGAARRI
ncbi:hypothetical protein HC928_13920 [bacterium]|nr:hypothetical protein [bacterium]